VRQSGRVGACGVKPPLQDNIYHGKKAILTVGNKLTVRNKLIRWEKRLVVRNRCHIHRPGGGGAVGRLAGGWRKTGGSLVEGWREAGRSLTGAGGKLAGDGQGFNKVPMRRCVCICSCHLGATIKFGRMCSGPNCCKLP
jgi:hypothetical protein